MEQRAEFVLRWLTHETSMAELCRQFGVSRQTGYALVARYSAEGFDGLRAHSRAPRHHPNAIAEDVCAAVPRAQARRRCCVEGCATSDFSAAVDIRPEQPSPM